MNSKKLDFGNGPIAPLFRAIFFPTLIGMMFNSALNICDGMFVGHGVGPDALAAINIVAPLFLICTGIGLAFGIGASVIGGIRLAEKNAEAACQTMTRAFIAGSAIFGAVIAVSFLFTRKVIYLLGCSEVLEPYATDYLLWILPGLLFFYVQCVGMMLIRLDGSPRYAMTVQIIAAVTNIFLDWLMVFPLGMGIKGAAIATSISCCLGGCLVLIYFLKFSAQLRFCRMPLDITSLKATLRSAGHILRIGFATLLTELAMGIMMITGNFMFLDLLGEPGVAAFSVGCYLFPLIFSVSNAVAQAAQPIISFNYGAGNAMRVNRTLGLSLRTAIVCGLLISGAMWVGAPLLSSVFLPVGPAHSISAAGLPLLGICATFFAVNITFIGYYQSVEQALRSTAYTLLRGIVILIPVFLTLPRLIGAPGLWLAIPLTELFTLIIICSAFLWQKKHHA